MPKPMHLRRVALPDPESLPDLEVAAAIQSVNLFTQEEHAAQQEVVDLEGRRPHAKETDNAALTAWIVEGRKGKPPAEKASEALEAEIAQAHRMYEATASAADEATRSLGALLSENGPGLVTQLQMRESHEASKQAALVDELELAYSALQSTRSLIAWVARPMQDRPRGGSGSTAAEDRSGRAGSGLRGYKARTRGLPGEMHAAQVFAIMRSDAERPAIESGPRTDEVGAIDLEVRPGTADLPRLGADR